MSTEGKKQVSMTEFSEARLGGKTVKELSIMFGISEINCKKIIKQLGLPKRATSPNYELVDDRKVSTGEDREQRGLTEDEEELHTQETAL